FNHSSSTSSPIVGGYQEDRHRCRTPAHVLTRSTPVVLALELPPPPPLPSPSSRPRRLLPFHHREGALSPLSLSPTTTLNDEVRLWKLRRTRWLCASGSGRR
ncbi:Os11g0155350, partial [Oryza sativa Japonica Group]